MTSPTGPGHGATIPREMRIHTRRLLLREFLADDWPAVQAYQSDPRYLRYYAWQDRTAEEVRRFVRMFLDQQAEHPRTRWQLAITLRPSGQLIGNCGIRRRSPTSLEADLGYELAPDHWGRGYATEAAEAMLAFAFGDLALHRVAANCLAENRASARLLERLGLRLEGRLRENEHFKGRFWDTELYGILAEEWRERRAGRAGGGAGPRPPA